MLQINPEKKKKKQNWNFYIFFICKEKTIKHFTKRAEKHIRNFISKLSLNLDSFFMILHREKILQMNWFVFLEVLACRGIVKNLTRSESKWAKVWKIYRLLWNVFNNRKFKNSIEWIMKNCPIFTM